ncbi:MAG: hypothetical protein JWO03_1302 [Bacteroidetes bacterium]|nr:hypothetical protein [Bacteroidota bacterium]
MSKYLASIALLFFAWTVCAQQTVYDSADSNNALKNAGISKTEFRKWTSEKDIRRVAITYHSADKLDESKLSKEELNELFEGCRNMAMFRRFMDQILPASSFASKNFKKQKLIDIYIAWYLYREYIIHADPMK